MVWWQTRLTRWGWGWLGAVAGAIALVIIGLQPYAAPAQTLAPLMVSQASPFPLDIIEATTDKPADLIAAATTAPTDLQLKRIPIPSAPAVTEEPLVSMASYQPPTEVRWAHPTNFGDRYATDINGRPAINDFIIVLHETVGSATSAINTFQTPHPRDEDQVSYHTLIRQDGTVIYIVPPDKRAFGAGNSVFDGPNGPETVVTNAAFPGSVNNFAYHVSLETPGDGRGNGRYHSGYTDRQYRSLAWLIAQSTVPENRITTHQAVDRSGSRLDPRSFSGQTFLGYLRQFNRGV